MLNAMAVGKLLWGVAAGDGSGWSMAVPAAAGLLAGNLVIGCAARRRQTRGELEPASSKREEAVHHSGRPGAGPVVGDAVRAAGMGRAARLDGRGRP
jgi:hypothetical protein